MNIQDILNALNLGEDKEWEFKSAKGGLPGNLWETYSAMANTDGGVIVLGIRQKDSSFQVQGLDEPKRIEQDFWNLVNNKGKVSLNLLSNHDVTTSQIDGKSVLVIRVPRASRTQRPVFVGQNPLEGTYRRCNEGDYRCSQDEVGRMLADQSEQPADSLILRHFGLDDLHKKSLEQYRNRFASRSPAHPWLSKDDRGLLEMLGGWRRDRSTGEEGLTVAGLLMFGKDEAVISDPHGVPQYHLSYRECLSDDPAVRWTDRISPDGTWPANLFQFFLRVYPRLVADLKVPFQYKGANSTTTTTTPAPDAVQRLDETIVHEAVREAFVNAIIHADFRGKGGIVVDRFQDQLIFANPGTLLVSIEQMRRGGVSECRNKSLQKMFASIGFGEKEGSGIGKITQGWRSQKWRFPFMQELVLPDRVRLVLPMISLLPEKSLATLQTCLGDDYGYLTPEEVQALVTADVEGEVSNLRLQQFSQQHRTDITKTLQNLVSKRFLRKDGHGRWATYRLDGPLKPVESEDTVLENSPHNASNSPHNASNSPHNALSSPHNASNSPHNALSDPTLLAISQPAREKQRIATEQMEQIILDLCQDRFLTLQEIGSLVSRDPKNLRDRYLRPMAKADELSLRYPDEPNHPNQAYTTKAIKGARE